MGNCLTSNKVVAQNDQDEEPQGSSCQAPVIKETGKVITASNLDGSSEVADGGVLKIKKKNNKVVRFELNEENNIDSGKQGESENGVVRRIRLVVTQKELKQILSSREDLNNSTIEELVRVMKLRGTRVSDDDDDGFNGAWRPALESIPEEETLTR